MKPADGYRMLTLSWLYYYKDPSRIHTPLMREVKPLAWFDLVSALCRDDWNKNEDIYYWVQLYMMYVKWPQWDGREGNIIRRLCLVDTKRTKKGMIYRMMMINRMITATVTLQEASKTMPRLAGKWPFVKACWAWKYREMAKKTKRIPSTTNINPTNRPDLTRSSNPPWGWCDFLSNRNNCVNAKTKDG